MAYKNKDVTAFKKYSAEFIALIDDLDLLLGSRKDFLLGSWIADARAWGTNGNEKALYEKNARDLITLWGDANCPLNEYACRQWSGLLSDFYKPRWQQFFALAEESIRTHMPFDPKIFEVSIAKWEWKWVNKRQDYPVDVLGDPIVISKKLHVKYREGIGEGM
jgi:alpha-N-acetylglucosaminidase